MNEDIQLQPEEEGKELGYFPFEELPPVIEVIECDIGNINIQHADPVDINIEIELSMKDEKLAKLQECDSYIKHLRKQYTKNSLNRNTYTMENNILKQKPINNGLLYTPIVVPDILKDCC